MGSGGLNSSLHVYTANILPTKPSSQPNLWFLKNIVIKYPSATSSEVDFKVLGVSKPAPADGAFQVGSPECSVSDFHHPS